MLYPQISQRRLALPSAIAQRNYEKTCGDNWTNHYWWQGKFYRLEGGSWPAEPGWLAPDVDVSKFPPLSVCGIGKVDGLLGANCRHSIGPGDGVHNPFEHFDSEENRKREKLEQRQRAMERNIRASRREAMGAQTALEMADDPELRAALEQLYRVKAEKLARQEAAYDAFCEENDLRKLYDRLFVANGSEKTPQTIANSGKSDIMEPDGAGSMGVDIELDKFTPCLEDAKTGEIVSTTYSLASKKELKGLTGKGWAFHWGTSNLGKANIYKLNVKGDNEIQGLIAITPYERDKAMYVNIVESAPQNKGVNRRYFGVGGHLFAIAAQESINRGFGGFMFLDAKNMELVEYYQKQLGAVWIGGVHQYRMLIDEQAAHVLLNKYTLGGNSND